MSLLGSIVEMDYAISRNVLEWVADGSRSRTGIIELFLENSLVKGAVPACALWFLWFKKNNTEDTRFKIVAAFAITLLAIVAGRVLAKSLPFRMRPLATPEVMGNDIQSSYFLENWSSMPSDHAVMFFALGVCVFLISRTLGIFLLLHAGFLVCGARVILGRHFLSDIIVGATIGAVMAYALLPPLTRFLKFFYNDYKWKIRPEIGYPLLFIITFQITTMFDSSRNLVGQLLYHLF